MTDIQARIDTLLHERRARLPAVMTELERWGRLDGCLNQLTTALDQLRAHPKTPEEVRGSMTGLSGCLVPRCAGHQTT